MENGSELDQNLATVFGISLEIPDSTQILVEPVTLHLNAWKPPAYSPYTKEQVLAATIWCLIRSSGSSPDHPLELRVVAESENDKLLEKKYSGKYISDPDEDKKIAATTNIGGTTIEEDARGIAWVILPGTKVDKSFKTLSPALIISENLGDGDSGWHIMPVWGNGENPEEFLKLNQYSANMIYSAWSTEGLQNANTFINRNGSQSFDLENTETSTDVKMSYQYGEPESLAANIFALILAQQPTEKHPLIVSFWLEESGLKEYSAFRKAAGWVESKPHPSNPNLTQLKCEFVWDPKTNKLIKGSLPLITANKKTWIELVTPSEEE